MLRVFHNRGWGTSILVAGFFLVSFAASVVWKASRTLDEAAEALHTESTIPYTSSFVQEIHPAGIEWISAPATFHNATWFQGHLYLASPSGLFQYDQRGSVVNQYRVGLELPTAKLRKLATGAGPGSSEPTLFLATTGGGLLLFDGRRFQQILPADPSYQNLTSILPLSSGRILLGTEKHGVLVYDGQDLRPLHPTLSGFHVTVLSGDESSLWVGTLGQGVLHWDGGLTKKFNEETGLPDRQVLSLATTDESAYVGTPTGVAEFRQGEFFRLLGEGFFAHSLLLQDQTLFLGTLEEGAYPIPLQAHFKRTLRSAGMPLPGAAEQLLEYEGTVYAVSHDGLYRATAQGAGWEKLIDRGATLLADANISALSVDATGKLWVGYFDRGLDIIEPDAKQAIHLEDENLFCINRIVQDPRQNKVAVATANGLALFDTQGRRRQILGPGEGLIANHVTDVLLHDEGAMTIATPAGLTLVDQTGLRSLYAFHGLVNNRAYALAASGKRLLIGTLGGLSVMEEAAVHSNYTTANSDLPHNWITSIEAVDEDWFVGTYGAGVLRFSADNQWDTFPDLPQSFVVNPNALLVTAEHVFAGTLSQGLYVYNRTSQRWTSLTDGLPSANVTALAEHQGIIYVGTDNGLVLFPEKGLAKP